MKTLFDDQLILSKVLLEPASFKSEERFAHPGGVIMNADDRLAIASFDFSAQSAHTYLANTGQIRVDDITGADFAVKSPDMYLANTGQIRVDDRLAIASADSSAQSAHMYLANTAHISVGVRPATAAVEFGPKSAQMYLASAECISVGDILGRNCVGVGYQSSADMHSVSSSDIKVGDVLGNTSVEVSCISSTAMYSASSPYIKIGDMPWSGGFGFKSSADLCSASSGSIGIEWMFGNTRAGYSPISLFDPNTASAGIKLGDSYGNTIHSFNPAANLCSVSIDSIGAERVFANTGAANSPISLFYPNSSSTGIKLGDRYGNTILSSNPAANLCAVSSARIVVEPMFVNTGDSFRSIELGLVTTNPSNLYQNIFRSIQQSPASFISFGSPLSLVSAGEYFPRQCVLTEDFYAYSARAIKLRFEVKLPLQSNDGINVPAEVLEEAKRELLELFGGVSWDIQPRGGLWKDGGSEYRDTHVSLIVDAPDTENSRRSMQQFKERWRRRLGQVELYMTTSVVEIM